MHSNVQPPVEPGTLRRPGLAISLLAAVAATCVALGFWQLGRADESRALAERVTAAAQAPPVRLRPAEGAPEALRYRRAEVMGRYVPERQILLDNIVRDGVAGYHVLTPFEPRDGGPWIVVNRGWIGADPDRRRLPDVPVDAEPRTVAGILDKLPSPGLRLERPPVDAASAPLTVLSYPEIDELEALLGRELLDLQLLLDAVGRDGRDARDGLVSVTPAPGLDPGRHLAYAAQWWLFAAIAGGAAAALVWRIFRRRWR